MHCDSVRILEGIQREGLEFKTSLYADDLLLYVSDPTSSLPCILDILNQFGKISGYKLNLQKSELLPLNSKADEIPSNLFPLKRVQIGLKYLGIEITRSFSATFKKNFMAVLNRCKQDMNRLTSIPLSVAGHVSLIKIMVLPKKNLFQNILILIKKSSFRTLDKTIVSFIWANKPSRISKTQLQGSKRSCIAKFDFLFLGMQHPEINLKIIQSQIKQTGYDWNFHHADIT